MEPEPMPALEALMDAAWPAAEREESGGWVLRAASGVTQRANSVWPREPGGDPHGLLASAPGGAPLVPEPPAAADLPGVRRPALRAAQRRTGRGRVSPGSPKPWCWSGTAARIRRRPTPASRSPRSPPRSGCGCGGAWTAAATRRPSPSPAGSSNAAPRCTPWCGTTTAGPPPSDALPSFRRVAALLPARAGCTAWRRARTPAGAATPRRILQGLLRAGDARGLGSYWLLVTASNAGARELYAPRRLPGSGPVPLPAGTAEAAPDRLLTSRPAAVSTVPCPQDVSQHRNGREPSKRRARGSHLRAAAPTPADPSPGSAPHTGPRRPSSGRRPGDRGRPGTAAWTAPRTA